MLCSLRQKRLMSVLCNCVCETRSGWRCLFSTLSKLLNGSFRGECLGQDVCFDWYDIATLHVEYASDLTTNNGRAT